MANNKNWLDDIDNLEAPLKTTKQQSQEKIKRKTIYYPQEWEDRIKNNKAKLNSTAFIRQAIFEKLEKDNL